MPQYQVDSEQIQSSSAAVNASIQSIRQAAESNPHIPAGRCK